MRIDQPDPMDEPGDDHEAAHDRVADAPDATGKGQDETASVGGFAESIPILSDSALRVELAKAYRARVDAVFRQCDIDHGHGRAREPEREVVISASHRIEVEVRQRCLTGPEDHPKEEVRLAGSVDGGAPLARDGQVSANRGGWTRDQAVSTSGSREFRVVAASDAVPMRDDGPYCPVSELKGDEPDTAKRLLEAPEFTGKGLRGFKDTDNPDFIDDYKRTYDAVGGPTAWARSWPNMAKLINQIRRHIYEKDGNDFTVLDLTGASGAQVDEVFARLDEWRANPEMSPKNKLIILGGSY